jgi:hypothetical protein
MTLKEAIVDAWTCRKHERDSLRDAVLVLGLFIPSMIVAIARGLMARYGEVRYSVVSRGDIPTASARMSALRAADMWNDAIGRKVFVPVESGGLVVEFASHEDGSGGQYFPLVSLIKIWSGGSADSIIAHEFGHALGLFHAKEGIMSPAEDSLSERDRRLARRRFGKRG